MIPELLSYLQGAEHDFGQGFALFCKYSRSEPLMSWIGRKRDMKKLLYELGKLARMNPRPNPYSDTHLARYGRNMEAAAVTEPKAEPPVEERAKPAPALRFRTFDERKTRRGDLPPEFQKVYDDIASDYKLRRAVHEKMKMATTDADRAEYRSLILETDARIVKGWYEIDEYQRRAAEEAQKGDNFNESTCRSYISKALARKKNSAIQINTVRARLKALQEHGCVVEEKTMKALREKGLVF